MSVLAVIPARLAASRLPGKPLRLVGGEPLIVRVLQRVLSMPAIDDVVVATDSPEIGEAVAAASGAWRLTGAAHESGTDRVAEVAARSEYRLHGVIVNVQGDEPFLSDEAVGGAIAMVSARGFPLGTAAIRAKGGELLSACDDPNVVKVVCADDERAMYFSRAPVPWLRHAPDQALRAAHVRIHLGVYAYTPRALQEWVGLPVHPLERLEGLEQLRPLAAGIAMGVAAVTDAVGPGVDTEEDLVRANARWNDLYAGRT